MEGCPDGARSGQGYAMQQGRAHTLLQSGRMEAHDSTLQKINAFTATLQNVIVFSATVKGRQILPQARIHQNMETLQDLDYFLTTMQLGLQRCLESMCSVKLSCLRHICQT